MSNTNSLTDPRPLGLKVIPPPLQTYYVAASAGSRVLVTIASAPSTDNDALALAFPFPLSAPHLLCIAHHSFISWWPSKKKNQIKTVFSARGASSLLITGARLRVRAPRCHGQFLRPNQSFTGSTPSNRIHQRYPTHCIHILCNFFIRDFPRAKWKGGRFSAERVCCWGYNYSACDVWGTCAGFFFWSAINRSTFYIITYYRVGMKYVIN